MHRKKTKRVKKEMNKKISMITDIPDSCLACDAPFDKTSEEQVKSWFVVVRNEAEKPNLYCPSCWKMANKIIEDYKNKNMPEEAVDDN